MPQCGCYHKYELNPNSDGTFKLRVRLEGCGDLRTILERTALVESIKSESNGGFYGFDFETFVLEGVREPESLARFLDMLRHRIIVDLSPLLDECYSLGPYSVFEGDKRLNAVWGDLVYRSKYSKEPNAKESLLAHFQDFVDSHNPIRTVDTVIAAPKTDPTTADLAGYLAQSMSARRGWTLAQASKIVASGPQKNLTGSEDESELVDRMKNTISINGLKANARVLLVDDTIRSGGTLLEMARDARAKGAVEVYGISAAKDARMTFGGVVLDKEAW